MKQVRRVIASSVAAFAFFIGSSMIGSASMAAAAYGIDMNVACQLNHGTSEWVGYLPAGSSNVMDWRCRDRYWPHQADRGVNLNQYCQYYYGSNAYYTNFNNPYSWYCP